MSRPDIVVSQAAILHTLHEDHKGTSDVCELGLLTMPFQSGWDAAVSSAASHPHGSAGHLHDEAAPVGGAGRVLELDRVVMFAGRGIRDRELDYAQ